jgi:hypothetical protein
MKSLRGWEFDEGAKIIITRKKFSLFMIAKNYSSSYPPLESDSIQETYKKYQVAGF